MKITKNYGIIYQCWGCGEEYTPLEVYHLVELQNDLSKEEVICPICNGYIINPKGEACTKGVVLD